MTPAYFRRRPGEAEHHGKVYPCPVHACQQFFRRCQLGFRLEPRHGGKLAVNPGDTVPSALVAELRQNKREILDLLEGKAAGLRPDAVAWLHVAR